MPERHPENQSDSEPHSRVPDSHPYKEDTVDKEELRDSLRSSRAESEDSGKGEKEEKTEEVDYLNRYHMKRIYDYLKPNGIRLTSEEFSHNLGRTENMLANDTPTEEELESLPQACLEYFKWFGSLDVVKALRRYRQQGLRKEAEEEQREQKETENTFRHPQDRRGMSEEMARLHREMLEDAE